MVKNMGESSDYPLWEKWASVADPINSFLAYAVLGLAFLGWILSAVWFGGFYPPLLFTAWNLTALICGILAGVFYLIFVMKAVKNKELTKMMHIWLIVCTALSWVSWWPIGILVTLQFVMVGILSDVPLWMAFSE